MTIKSEIRDGAANAALNIAQIFGVSVTYTASATTILLYAMIENTSRETLNMQAGFGLTDDESIVFVVPRQTSFPPAAFQNGATITYGTKIYDIDDIEYDCEDITQSASFRLTCSRQKLYRQSV